MSVPITIVSKSAMSIFAASGAQAQVVESLEDIARFLADVAIADEHASHTLDLTGHTRRGTKLLALGRDTLDLLVPTIERVMMQLAASGVLRRLRIHALRLIGCETAVTPAGQLTIKRLARLLDLPVYGTRKRIGSAHYDSRGFDSTFEHLLIESAELPAIGQRLPLVR